MLELGDSRLDDQIDRRDRIEIQVSILLINKREIKSFTMLSIFVLGNFIDVFFFSQVFSFPLTKLILDSPTK